MFELAYLPVRFGCSRLGAAIRPHKGELNDIPWPAHWRGFWRALGGYADGSHLENPDCIFAAEIETALLSSWVRYSRKRVASFMGTRFPW